VLAHAASPRQRHLLARATGMHCPRTRLARGAAPACSCASPHRHPHTLLARGGGGGCAACLCSWPRGPRPGGGPVAITGEFEVAQVMVVDRGAATSTILDGVASIHSIVGRPDLEPPRPDPSLHLPFGWWCEWDRLVLCDGSWGERSFGESHARLREDGGDACGRHSYPIEDAILGPLVLRLGVLASTFLGFLVGCSFGVGPARLVHQWTIEGGNARWLGGVTPVWLFLQLSSWCWRSPLLYWVFRGNFSWLVLGGWQRYFRCRFSFLKALPRRPSICLVVGALEAFCCSA
jgi:hypothetical protein